MLPISRGNHAFAYRLRSRGQPDQRPFRVTLRWLEALVPSPACPTSFCTPRRFCDGYAPTLPLTLRDSLPEPDLFRLVYRDALVTVVAEIVRRGLKPTPAVTDALAAPLVPPEDALQLRELVQIEIGR